MSNISDTLSKSTAKHVAALFFGGFMDLLRQGSADYIDSQGTLTFISYRGLCLGVTNQHVVGEYERPTPDRVFHVALNRHTALPGRLLFKSTQVNPDFPFDIAVFLLDEAAIVNGGKVPIPLSESFESIQVDDQALVIGFPGDERVKKDEQLMSHGLYHVVASCIGASDQKIMLYESLPSSENKPYHFGGMSGGPIFRLKSGEAVGFSGILFEARGLGDTDSGQIGDDIGVLGFPFGPSEIERAFDAFKPRL